MMKFRKEVSGLELLVDGSRSVAEAIADGNYAWFDPRILELGIVPGHTGLRSVYADVLRPTGTFPLKAAREFLNQEGYRSCLDYELFAFGGQYPDYQDLWGIRGLTLKQKRGYPQFLVLNRFHECFFPRRRLQLFGTPEGVRKTVDSKERILAIRH